MGVYLTDWAVELASEALLDRRDRCEMTGIREGGDCRGGECREREEGRDCLCLVEAVVALLCERWCWGVPKVVAGSWPSSVCVSWASLAGGRGICAACAASSRAALANVGIMYPGKVASCPPTISPKSCRALEDARWRPGRRLGDEMDCCDGEVTECRVGERV